MMPFIPTKQQIRAIEYLDSLVITACPGSGKTTVIAEKISSSLKLNKSYQGIIGITFTKKASAELKRRCSSNAKDLKSSFFGTIDSFCYQELIIPFLSGCWGGEPRKCTVVKKLNDEQSALFVRKYTSPNVRELDEDTGFKQLYLKNTLWMSSFSALAVLILRESLAAQNYIVAKYTHVFMDEYQDSSVAQHELFLSLKDLGLVATAVGDTDQSIFKFRGSCPELLDCLVHSPDFKHIHLDENHRCHPSITNYANRLLYPDCDLLATDEIRVFRYIMNGLHSNAAGTVSTWITSWIQEKTVGKASKIAILAKTSNVLNGICDGLTCDYRLISDTPFDVIGTECSDLFSELLNFKHGATQTAQSLLDSLSIRYSLSSKKQKKLLEIIKLIRQTNNEEFIDFSLLITAELDLMVKPETIKATKEIQESEILLKIFCPLNDNEVQVMTLHKSKGLEFDIVIHFGLEEWSFPFRKYIEGRREPVYPELEQETNLHYVGITRAEKLCILIQTELRQNSYGEVKRSQPSYFLTLPQLKGLYIS
ncbi:TPA: ATP-dependent helicase [Proteus mirabilis]|nr:ATP-dependent helicase [Proteus mirabilis]HDU8343363.1 ATP-dependent helicase [Proteus mirabilis]